MNMLMLNGSPNPNVNTSIVLREMETYSAKTVLSPRPFSRHRDIHGCFTTGKCVFTGIANELVPKFKAA